MNVLFATAAYDLLCMRNLTAEQGNNVFGRSSATSCLSFKPQWRDSSGTETTPTSDLEELERRMILKVLQQSNGHQQRAAELLGISRRTLSRKLKAYAAGAGA